ncbi:uncharacterized protein LOC112512326 [Cynara cardunculus var. scolymus]|uniref:uncharacterized protein LOC112512326 n=1 Tax=Cynara cardunculus var. scolymus TaxID=59895 RepID=UPI000D62AEC9|nr:uncharacterized protein LOC112512326 [Cynara cardunculus var. scolymus]
MASSSSQSAQSVVSDEHQREVKRVKEVRNRTHASHTSMARRQWTKMEDMKLLKHVVAHGGTKWNILSEQLHGRSPDSCKVRWFNKWNPILQKKYGADVEACVVKDDDHARKHTKVTSSAKTAVRLPIDVESGSSTFVPLERPSEHGMTDNSLEITPMRISFFNGTSDVEEQEILVGNCRKCKRAMGGFQANGEIYMVSMYDADPMAVVSSCMNLLDSIKYESNNNQQPAVANVFLPQPPPPSPSTPKFIDFLGVGSE